MCSQFALPSDTGSLQPPAEQRPHCVSCGEGGPFPLARQHTLQQELAKERAARAALEAELRSVVAELHIWQADLGALAGAQAQVCLAVEAESARAAEAVQAASERERRACAAAKQAQAAHSRSASDVQGLTTQLLAMTAQRNEALRAVAAAEANSVEMGQRNEQATGALQAQITDMAQHLDALRQRCSSADAAQQMKHSRAQAALLDGTGRSVPTEAAVEAGTSAVETADVQQESRRSVSVCESLQASASEQPRSSAPQLVPDSAESERTIAFSTSTGAWSLATSTLHSPRSTPCHTPVNCSPFRPSSHEGSSLRAVAGTPGERSRPIWEGAELQASPAPGLPLSTVSSQRTAAHCSQAEPIALTSTLTVGALVADECSDDEPASSGDAGSVSDDEGYATASDGEEDAELVSSRFVWPCNSDAAISCMTSSPECWPSLVEGPFDFDALATSGAGYVSVGALALNKRFSACLDE